MNLQYISIYSLIVGFVLDAIVGDPYHWPHPIKTFGKVIGNGEKLFNHGRYKILKGGTLSFFLILSAYYLFHYMEKLISDCTIILFVFNVIFVFYGLANRTLINEALKVIRSLEKEGIEAGRKQLSYIVGRDTSHLSENQIKIAVLETISENLSDGVIAPIFYYAIGGIPLMFAYKMINTLDSMIGYKNERYKQFGLIAARIDDIANYIPSRFTAFLMALISFKWRVWKFIFRYGHLHSSPNAGYPEAALAGVLNCRFGGANIYHGKKVKKPFIGKINRTIFKADIIKACSLNAVISLFMVALVVFYLIHFSFLV
jgi:adenosylcobinamide-phosphate synthase